MNKTMITAILGLAIGPAMPSTVLAAPQQDSARAESPVMPVCDTTRDWDYKIEVKSLLPFLDPANPANPLDERHKAMVRELTKGILDAMPEKLTVTPAAKRRILLIARIQRGHARSGPGRPDPVAAGSGQKVRCV